MVKFTRDTKIYILFSDLNGAALIQWRQCASQLSLGQRGMHFQVDYTEWTFSIGLVYLRHAFAYTFYGRHRAYTNQSILRTSMAIVYRETLMRIRGAFNTLRPRQNGRHFPVDIFKCIFLFENVSIAIEISLKFVPKGPINNIPALVQIMA